MSKTTKTINKINDLLQSVSGLYLDDDKELELYNEVIRLREENKRLLQIAKKMHAWIFLHTGDEQEVYNELGLTQEENIKLGYSGQIKLKGSDE